MKWITDKKWWSLAGNRAIRTVAQAMLSIIGTSATFMHEINWAMVISAGLLGGVISILTSIAVGIPEYKEEDHA